MKIKNILSIFDGISAGKCALDRADIEYDNYYAYEIDKHAIKCSQDNHPDIIQLGDINNWEDHKLENVDLICAGSPCFTEDTLILTINGYKKIIDVNVGDLVLSHTGNFRKVLKTGGKKNVKVRRIEAFGGLPIYTTDEHPFYAKHYDFGNVTKPYWEESKNLIEFENYEKPYHCLSMVKAIHDEYGIVYAIDELQKLHDFVGDRNISDIPLSISDALKIQHLSLSVNNFLYGIYKNNKGECFLNETKSDLYDRDELYSWMPCKYNEENMGLHDVYNLEVDIDNSYTANNIVVHNCQGFSNSGKGLNFEDPRSALFFKFIDILKHYKPKYFLLENVVMKKEWSDKISEIIGVDYVNINSNKLSAQNRNRLYWANFPISQPEDAQIFWKDVKDKNVSIEQYYYSENALKWLAQHSHNRNKQLKTFEGDDTKFQMLEASSCKLYSSQRFFGIPDIPLDDEQIAAMRGRRISFNGGRSDYDYSISITQYLEFRYDNRSNCLSTVAKDNVVVPFTLPHRIPKDEFFFRYLTINECEKLQTFDENYCKVLSKTQAYKALGNSFTVSVIEHIFNCMKTSQ
jgi:site-specific DNA-cytosine methylase